MLQDSKEPLRAWVTFLGALTLWWYYTLGLDEILWRGGGGLNS